MTAWKITFTHKAAKQASKLPLRVRRLLDRLVRELTTSGPVQPGWPNYSKLANHQYHCHLSYRWVACWHLKGDELEVIEIYYAGSRENAPYR
jgi:hypothetical protein